MRVVLTSAIFIHLETISIYSFEPLQTLADNYEKVCSHMNPNSILCLSHGFLLGHLQSIGLDFPKNMSVIVVCPKGMGPSVRRLYAQGKEINGAGINISFVIHQEKEGLPAFLMGKINGQRMWKVGERIRATRPAGDLGPLYSFTAGVYVALMMVQATDKKK